MKYSEAMATPVPLAALRTNLTVVALALAALAAPAGAAGPGLDAAAEAPGAGQHTSADGSAEGEPGDAEGDESAAEPEDAEEESFEERLDKLLEEAAAEEIYGETENCLYRRRFSHIDVVSEDILIFSRGKHHWINHLKRSCRGLRRDMVLHTEVRGINSLCSNDVVYANRSSDLREGLGPGGRPSIIRAACVLGEFQSIPEPYADALLGLPP